MISGWYGAGSDWNVFFRVGSDLFHRSGGGVYFIDQFESHEASAGSGGRAAEFDTPVKKLGANSMKCNVDVVRIRENSNSAQWLGDRKDAGDGDHLSG